MVDKKSTMRKESNEEEDRKIPNTIVDLLAKIDKRSHNTDLMRKTIIELCSWRDFSIAELAEVLNRNEKYLKTNYIQPLIDKGKIKYTIPEMLTHPNQKYRAKKTTNK